MPEMDFYAGFQNCPRVPLAHADLFNPGRLLGLEGGGGISAMTRVFLPALSEWPERLSGCLRSRRRPPNNAERSL